ncbi:MAG: Gfo/Idh/MocA family oxidoreductase [Bacteroidota bacterium]|nr:Gfo/Idh/MocA family oxidoreductase [Bacteroidota bacterium]
MEKINWGIIGCGDVTETKSGPAFNKVKNSSLVAVMRRDAEKAKDYAQRHHVPKWYNDADALINDEEVNAIYIATPPAFHEEYALACLQAGKPVYVEKPMALNLTSATNIMRFAKEKNIKLSVAHYRREQPLFKKIKQLLSDKIIGDVRFIKLEFYRKSLSRESLLVPKVAWRVNTKIAGGGLFHDIAPHQLDLMYYFFGDIEKASGYAINQEGMYDADDIVSGNILFKSGLIFNGLWSFNVAREDEADLCEIVGSEGKISFPVFEHKKIEITKNGKTESIAFEPLQHVQEPMIGKVVDYFLDKSDNPCSGEDGATVMWLMEKFTAG